MELLSGPIKLLWDFYGKTPGIVGIKENKHYQVCKQRGKMLMHEVSLKSQCCPQLILLKHIVGDWEVEILTVFCLPAMHYKEITFGQHRSLVCV